MKPACWNDNEIEQAKTLRTAYDKDPQGTEPVIRQALSKYIFFQNVDLAPGIRSPGMGWVDRLNQTVVDLTTSLDFKGKRVLDIGCRDGNASFLAEARGAAEIYAMDNDPSPGMVNFIIPFRNSVIKPVECNLNDLDKLDIGKFDIVICCGVLYHLQFPIWGLRQIRNVLKPGGTLVLETGMLDAFEDFPMLAYTTGDTSAYEGSSPSFFNMAGLQNALSLLGFENIHAQSKWHDNALNVPKHFPKFAEKYNVTEKFKTFRLTAMCRLSGAYQHEASDNMYDVVNYFEGVHRMHSGGRDRTPEMAAATGPQQIPSEEPLRHSA